MNSIEEFSFSILFDCTSNGLTADKISEKHKYRIHNIANLYFNLVFSKTHLRRRVQNSRLVNQRTLQHRFTIDVDYTDIINSFRKWNLNYVILPILWYQKKIPLLDIDCTDECGTSMSIARARESRSADILALLGYLHNGIQTLLDAQAHSVLIKDIYNIAHSSAWMADFLNETHELFSNYAGDYIACTKEEILSYYSPTISNVLTNLDLEEFIALLEYLSSSYNLAVVIPSDGITKSSGLVKVSTLVEMNQEQLDNKPLVPQKPCIFRQLLNLVTTPTKLIEIDLPEFGEHWSACHTRFEAPKGLKLLNARLRPILYPDEDTDRQLDTIPPATDKQTAISAEERNPLSYYEEPKSTNYWKLVNYYIQSDSVDSSNLVARSIFDESSVEIQDVNVYNCEQVEAWKLTIELIPDLRIFHYPVAFILAALSFLFFFNNFMQTGIELLLFTVSAGVAFLSSVQEHYFLGWLFRRERQILVGLIIGSVPANVILRNNILECSSLSSTLMYFLGTLYLLTFLLHMYRLSQYRKSTLPYVSTWEQSKAGEETLNVFIKIT